jgi:hypothetical protein
LRKFFNWGWKIKKNLPWVCHSEQGEESARFVTRAFPAIDPAWCGPEGFSPRTGFYSQWHSLRVPLPIKFVGGFVLNLVREALVITYQ